MGTKWAERRQLPPQIRRVELARHVGSKPVARYQLTVDTGGVDGKRKQLRRRCRTEKAARAALAEITGPGGGKPGAPGSTPPDSAQTSGLSERQPQPGRRITPAAVASLVALAIFVLLFLAAAVALILGRH